MGENNSMRRLRLAIFTTEDVVWGLTTWKRTIPVVADEHEIVGIYIFPERLGSLRGRGISKWYLRVFGWWTCALLAVFAFKQRLRLFFSCVRSWRHLAQRYGLQLHRAESPNAPEVVRWSIENDIDVILIMVGSILKKDILLTARVGVINKHAAMLPACRGIFPFFWAKLTGLPTGVTFHEVDTQIDTGRILLQVKYPSPELSFSMLRFYSGVFAMYPAMVTAAIRRLRDGRFVDSPTDLPASYHSLPTREDYMEFQRRGFRICRFSDLFRRDSEPSKEIMHEVCGD